MKFFTVLLFAVSFSAFSQQQFNDLKVKNLELINETPSSVVITDDNKKTRTSTVSASELEGLSGVTGNIQEQIDAKVNLEGDETISGVKTFSGKIVSTSTTGGNSPCPPHDQASIDSLVDAEASDCVFNTTTKNLNVFDGTIWKSAGGGLSKWEEGKVFNLDDVVVYDNAIYRCVSAHTSSLPFEEVKWELISGDTVLNGARVKNVVVEKVIQTANDSFKIETDTDNLFTNGDFQAQNVMLGWQKGPGAGVGIHTTAPFVGNQSLSLQFVGSDADFWRDVTRPEYVGRMARITLYYKSSATWTTDIPQICTFIGSTSNISSCSIIKNTGGQWGLYQSPNFYWSDPKVGLIIKSNGKIDLVNEVLLGRARLELDKNEGFVANIEGDYQYLRLTGGSVSTGTNLDTLTKSITEGNSTLVSLSASGIKALRDIEIAVTIYSARTNSDSTNRILVDGVIIAAQRTVGSSYSQANSASVNININKDQAITFQGDGNSVISILAKARSQVTVFPDETFNGDVNGYTWAHSGQYTEATLPSAQIGTCITFKSTGATYTQTSSAEAPTQTNAQMRANGLLITGTTRAANSTYQTPSKFVCNIGKGYSKPSVTFYKDTAKSKFSSNLNLDYYGANAEYQTGMINSYDPLTGLITLDFKAIASGNTNAPNVYFSDRDFASSGYLVIKASKTGLGMANVPARYPVSVSPIGTSSWYVVYNDGWVRQGYKSDVAGTSTVTNLTFTIPMMDTNYAIYGAKRTSDSNASSNQGGALLHSTITTSYVAIYIATSYSGYRYIIEGYGASSVVKQYGANPAY